MRRRSGGQHSLEPWCFSLKAQSYFVRFRTRGQHSLESWCSRSMSLILYRIVVLLFYGRGDVGWFGRIDF